MNQQDQEQIKQIFDQYILEYAKKNAFGVSLIPFHNHDGINSPYVKTIVIPVFSSTDATVAPTDTPKDGTVRMLYDSTHWYMWIKINSLWKSVSFT